MLEQWIKIAECAALTDYGTLRVAVPGSEDVCVYRLGDEYFATSNQCSHGAASLSDGLIVDSGLIECPLHEGTFDIRTGRPIGAPCTVAISIYSVKVIDGDIFLQMTNKR